MRLDWRGCSGSQDSHFSRQAINLVPAQLFTSTHRCGLCFWKFSNIISVWSVRLSSSVLADHCVGEMMEEGQNGLVVESQLPSSGLQLDSDVRNLQWQYKSHPLHRGYS